MRSSRRKRYVMLLVDFVLNHAVAWFTLTVALTSALAVAIYHLRRQRYEQRELRCRLEHAESRIGELRKVAGLASQRTAQLQELLCETKHAYAVDQQALLKQLSQAAELSHELEERRALVVAELNHRTAECDALREELDRASSDATRRELRIEQLEDLLAENYATAQSLAVANDREETELERLKDELVRTETTLDQLRDEVRHRVQAQTQLERKLEGFRRSFRAVAARH